MRDQIGELLGCDWGYRIFTADYPQPCDNAAVQIVVLHDHDVATRDVKLCTAHREFVLGETNPHVSEVSRG